MFLMTDFEIFISGLNTVISLSWVMWYNKRCRLPSETAMDLKVPLNWTTSDK